MIFKLLTQLCESFLQFFNVFSCLQIMLSFAAAITSFSCCCLSIFCTLIIVSAFGSPFILLYRLLVFQSLVGFMSSLISECTLNTLSSDMLCKYVHYRSLFKRKIDLAVMIQASERRWGRGELHDKMIVCWVK